MLKPKDFTEKYFNGEIDPLLNTALTKALVDYDGSEEIQFWLPKMPKDYFETVREKLKTAGWEVIEIKEVFDRTASTIIRLKVF